MIATAMPQHTARILSILVIIIFLTPASASMALDLETVQEAIRLSGAQWQAADTELSRLSVAEKKRLLGALPDPELAAAPDSDLVRAVVKAPLPSRFDWRNVEDDNYVTPAKDQGSCGSCWAFAAVGALESYVMLRTHQPGLAIDLAEQSLLSCETSGGCGGGSGWTAAQKLRDIGVPNEACLPYAENDTQDCDERCDDWEQQAQTISSFQQVIGNTSQLTRDEIVTDLKTHLAAYGPLWTTMVVYDDFYSYQSGIYTHTTGDRLDGHAILLIGYDDAAEAFTVKNSWGAKWPNNSGNGSFRIAYSQVANEVEFGAFTYTYGDPVAIGPEAPTADAGSDQTVDENEAVTLDGRGSSDPDGEIDTYAWHRISGPAVSLSGTDTPRPSFTTPNLTSAADAEIIFELTVTDDDGLTATDTITVTVTWANDAPVARAGSNRQVAERAPVTLNGDSSTDPEGQTLSYRWSQIGSPTVSLADQDQAAASFTAPQLTTAANTDLVFELRVTDAQGASATDRVTITVVWGNDAPVARAGDDREVAERAPVTLDGSASSDREGQISGYHWSQIGSPTVSLTGQDQAAASFTAPNLATGANADLVFELRVTDAQEESTTDRVTITVIWENDAPVAKAGEDQRVAEGSTVILDGGASTDTEGSPILHQWRQVKGAEVTLSDAQSARASFTVPPLTAEANLELAFELTVTDEAGLSASDQVEVTIVWNNQTPTAAAGEDQTVAGGAQVTLDGSGSSDSDDSLATYAWSQVAGPSVELSTPTAAQAGFTAPPNNGTDPLQLRFTLQVTDTGGLSATDDVEIWITPQADPTDPTDPQDPGDNPSPGDEPDSPKDTPEPEVTSSGGGSGGCFITQVLQPDADL